MERNGQPDDQNSDPPSDSPTAAVKLIFEFCCFHIRYRWISVWCPIPSSCGQMVSPFQLSLIFRFLTSDLPSLFLLWLRLHCNTAMPSKATSLWLVDGAYCVHRSDSPMCTSYPRTRSCLFAFLMFALSLVCANCLEKLWRSCYKGSC